MNFSAVILAGGKSTRMGRDKAWLEVGGQSLLARQIGIVREFGATDVFISGRAGVNYSGFGCRVLQDKYSNAGPLGGIERALDAAQSPITLVLAVDLPEMSASFLRRLATGCSETCGVIPQLAGHMEPLAAFYPKISHSLVDSLLRIGLYAVANFAGNCVQSGLARFVETPASEAKYFTNWNSQTDFAPPATSS